MPDQPLIAVVIPVYNPDIGFLKQALASLRRNASAYKVVLVDDGSAADVRAMLADDAAGVDYIRLPKNAGVSAARNAGIAAARKLGADYIATLDADDYSEPHRLDIQQAYLDAHPDIGAVGSWVQFETPAGEMLFQFEPPERHEAIQRYLYNNNPLHQSSVMFRARALMDSGLYDEKLRNSEDYDLIWRLSKRWRLANIQQLLTHYRVNPEGLSLRRRNEQMFNRLRIQLRYCSFAEPYSFLGMARTVLIALLPRQLVRGIKQKLGSSRRWMGE